MDSKSNRLINFCSIIYYAYAALDFLPLFLYALALIISWKTAGVLGDLRIFIFCIFPSISLILGLSLHWRRTWVRRANLGFALLLFLQTGWHCYRQITEAGSSLGDFLFGLAYGLCAPFFLLIFYILTRPQVKEQFK